MKSAPILHPVAGGYFVGLVLGAITLIAYLGMYVVDNGRLQRQLNSAHDELQQCRKSASTCWEKR